MKFDRNNARQYLQTFSFKKLFIEELGWDHPASNLDLPCKGEQLHLTAVAQKRGLAVFVCSPLEPFGQIPDYTGRRKIEAELRKSSHEHILIFTNSNQTKQVWQWVRREPGRPTTSREYEYNKGQTGDALLDRLQGLVFTLEEEENLGIIDVTSRVRATFDVELVTRRFYDRFKDEHVIFLEFLSGIPDVGMQRWYVSVTLNRLMFVYFIQKRQFLNGDENYLHTKLIESASKGKDLFYHDFLCPLFFEGFAIAKEDRKPETKRLLGDVPYLNGGIFQQHQIETAFGKEIQIPDAAFERVFNFFDQYRWHLDERPLRNDSEINPDVLGYIFEKYINQKEMGAYYTKEDITGYISRSTILPYLLDKTQKECAIAFKGEQSVWRLLASDPRRYIFPSIQKGCDLSLPAEIQAGLEDVSKREGWNKPANEDFSLPTETWREVVARRTRYEDLVKKLGTGEIHQVNDLITYNLDIEQFTQDVVEASEGPELLRAFWNALRGIKVLDPTCGSGAFLFAALNILEPLYEACLERMRVFVAELEQSAEKHRPEKFSDFREVLDQVELHHNERYFILKSIIVNNLYGVDIMEEAVEICKLRLFLKLIAQVEQAKDVEPLPDIDFNIRAGNTLVGFTTLNQIQYALNVDSKGQFTSLLDSDLINKQIAQIEEEAELANRAYLQFQRQQLEHGLITGKDKEVLHERLNKLNNELNHALARTYGIDPNNSNYSSWLSNHKPFHWLTDFYGIMLSGGFDVIIGNPPYVDYNVVKKDYKVKGYKSESCNNLYGYCIERSLNILAKNGRCGMIVPLSLTFSRDFISIRQMLIETKGTLWQSSYDNIPDRLFTGVKESSNTSKSNQQRTTIFITDQTPNCFSIHSSPLLRWKAIERYRLFSELEVTNTTSISNKNAFPKVGNEKLFAFYSKWFSQSNKLASTMVTTSSYSLVVPKTAGYYIAAYPEEMDRTKQSILHFRTRDERDFAFVLLNSNVFFWLWRVSGDGFDVTMSTISSCPIFKPSNSIHSKIAEEMYQALPECTVYKAYRGVNVPNVNFNLRMDLLFKADDWIINNIAPDLELSSLDFLWSKSNSCFRMSVPKSANYPFDFDFLNAFQTMDD